jgi:antitoxin (DNA-binding transcriptional repressor) of toxin-antitoxin stability system
MPKSVVHISEAEATSNFAEVLARVRAGAEVVIEGKEPVVVAACTPTSQAGRPLSESIAMAETHAKELGYEPILDADFAADLEAVIKRR